MTRINAVINAIHGHARSCKKPLDECAVCKNNVSAMKDIPAPMLSELLQDVMRPTLRVPLIDIIAEKVFGDRVPSKHAQTFLGVIGAQFDTHGRIRLAQNGR